MGDDLQARLEQERAKLGTMLERLREDLRHHGVEFGGGGLIDIISGIENLAEERAALLREVLALRSVLGELMPHVKHWKDIGPLDTGGWLSRQVVQALIHACAAADAAKEAP